MKRSDKKSKSFLRYLTGFIMLLAVFIALFLYIVTLQCDEVNSKYWNSLDIEESKAEKRFIKSVSISPRVCRIGNLSIEFNEIWLEHNTQINYQYYIFKKITALDNKKLCFNLKYNRCLEEPIYFLLGEDEEPFILSSRDGKCCYCKNIEELDKPAALSVVNSLKDKRKKDFIISVD